MECEICTETFNKTAHASVECYRCHKKVCRSCVERYILENVNDPHCMFPECGTAWDRMFLAQVMKASFLQKAYVKHREEVLFERERALLPQTMPLVVHENRVKELRDEIYETTRRLRQLANRRDELNQELHVLQAHIHHIYNGDLDPNAQIHGTQAERPTPSTNYRRPCAKEDCNGFLEPQTGACISCKNSTCLRCNVVKVADVEHECKEEDTLQWAEIQRSTRPCPGCSTRIFKTTGCDQTWCPQCHTAFRWSTGQIERGAIHNPHYYEWMFDANRQGPRVQQQQRPEMQLNMCVDGQMPGLREVRDRMGATRDSMVARIHRTVRHYQHIIRTDAQIEQNTSRKKMKIRVAFIMNSVTEKQFRERLQRIEKENGKLKEYHRIIDTYSTMMTDQFQRFVRRDIERQDIEANADRIMRITNSAVNNLNKIYNSSLPFIHIQYG